MGLLKMRTAAAVGGTGVEAAVDARPLSEVLIEELFVREFDEELVVMRESLAFQ